MKSLKNCKNISRYAIGIDTIDQAAAREKGIMVANVPDYCIEEVSDTAIALIFNYFHKVRPAQDLLQRGEWAYARIKLMRRFASLIVGLVAFGNFARRVAQKLRSFSNSILANDPYFHDHEKYS